MFILNIRTDAGQVTLQNLRETPVTPAAPSGTNNNSAILVVGLEGRRNTNNSNSATSNPSAGSHTTSESGAPSESTTPQVAIVVVPIPGNNNNNPNSAPSNSGATPPNSSANTTNPTNPPAGTSTQAAPAQASKNDKSVWDMIAELIAGLQGNSNSTPPPTAGNSSPADAAPTPPPVAAPPVTAPPVTAPPAGEGEGENSSTDLKGLMQTLIRLLSQFLGNRNPASGGTTPNPGNSPSRGMTALADSRSPSSNPDSAVASLGNNSSMPVAIIVAPTTAMGQEETRPVTS